MKTTYSSRLVSATLALSLLVGVMSRPAQAFSLPSLNSVKSTAVKAAVGTVLAATLAGLVDLYTKDSEPKPVPPKDDSWGEYLRYLWRVKWVGTLYKPDRVNYTREEIDANGNAITKYYYSKVYPYGVLGIAESYRDKMLKPVIEHFAEIAFVLAVFSYITVSDSHKKHKIVEVFNPILEKIFGIKIFSAPTQGGGSSRAIS